MQFFLPLRRVLSKLVEIFSILEHQDRLKINFPDLLYNFSITCIDSAIRLYEGSSHLKCKSDRRHLVGNHIQ